MDKPAAVSIPLLEKLSAGPLSLEARPLHLGFMSGFERRAKQVLIHPLYPRAVRWFLIGWLAILTYSAFWGPRDARQHSMRSPPQDGLMIHGQ